MVSGKYSALAGAVSREQAMNNISHNLANVSTVGYKKSMVSFESVLRGEKQIQESKGINYTRVRENYTEFSPGPLKLTDNPLDVAIKGEGFFKLEGVDETFYTKNGNFSMDSTGRLLSQNGLPVLDNGNQQITLPSANLNSIVIDSKGRISAFDEAGISTQIATLAVVGVSDPLDLQRVDNTLFSLKAEGEETELAAPYVTQGGLEVSNVNMPEEITKMITSQRIFETYHKVLESYKTLGEQLSELGTLS